MIELRFDHDFYDAAALDEAVKVYGAYGSIELSRAEGASVVRVSVGADAAGQGIDERILAAELGNFALGMTIEQLRTAEAGAATEAAS